MRRVFLLRLHSASAAASATPISAVAARRCVKARLDPGLDAFLAACGSGDTSSPAPASPPGPPKATVLNASLSSPWGMAFLLDGRMLVTQKGGSMVILSADGAKVEATVTGVPAVVASGQGGLLDIALDPEFDPVSNPWVYWSYSEAGADGNSTAVARGKLVGAALSDVTVIFRQAPKLAGDGHYGSRLAFRADGTLFVTLGERMYDDPSNPGLLYAQNVANHLGKVVRINRDGSVPADNPNLGIGGALPELWSYGHRTERSPPQRVPGAGRVDLPADGQRQADSDRAVSVAARGRITSL